MGANRSKFYIGQRRQRELLRDSVKGITKPAIRRLARRGGVLRMKSEIYDEIRVVIRKRVTEIVSQLVVVLDSATTKGMTRKTVTTRDVVFVLNRLGTPVYGFGPV